MTKCAEKLKKKIPWKNKFLEYESKKKEAYRTSKSYTEYLNKIRKIAKEIGI